MKSLAVRGVISLLLGAFLVLPVVAQQERAGGLLAGEALLEALRRGGYTIYFRHAATDWSQEDRVRQEGDWTSCDPEEMRQLSQRGRESARRIGEHLKELQIPVAAIYSSEYCRARETARLMGLGEVTATRALMNMRVAEMVGGREKVVERARALIASPPEPGSNTVLVAHGNLMRAATGSYAEEGGAADFEPAGEGRFTLVARIAPEQWAELAR
jgi:phosphohistidine phosphatase SixA